jgi:hypothetical protein
MAVTPEATGGRDFETSKFEISVVNVL